MEYLITFLEGLISFISPCMLPMLPVYIGYFAGNDGDRKKTFARACAFAAGFTVVFCLLGVFAGAVGSWLVRYRTAVNIAAGAAVVVFGLSYLDVLRLPFFKGMSKEANVTGIVSAFLFGVIYSVSLTPCVGAFLGSAIMLASSSADVGKGVALLLVYSLGLGVPFVLSAVLIAQLKGVFDAIKRHYEVINRVCGLFLIAVGIAMATGLFNKLIGILN